VLAIAFLSGKLRDLDQAQPAVKDIEMRGGREHSSDAAANFWHTQESLPGCQACEVEDRPDSDRRKTLAVQATRAEIFWPLSPSALSLFASQARSACGVVISGRHANRSIKCPQLPPPLLTVRREQP